MKLKLILVLLMLMTTLIACTVGECDDPDTGEQYSC